MRLFRRFILRFLVREWLRTAVTVLGVGLGVAVVIAIRLANASALRGFETALDTMTGRTSVEIVGAPLGIDETMLPELSWLGDHGVVSPVIEGDAFALVDPDAPRGEMVRVLAVDLLRDREIRNYRLLESAGDGPPSQLGGLELLIDPRSIVLTEKFARRHGVRIGGRLRLTVSDRQLDFTVRGLLADEGPARVLDGNLVLMDIASAQWAFNRLGRHRPAGRPAVRRGLDRSRRSGDRGTRPGRTGRPAPGAARPASGAHAGVVPTEPHGALVRGAPRRSLPRLQHGVDVGHREAGGNRNAARARRVTAERAGAVHGRGAAARPGGMQQWGSASGGFSPMPRCD